MEFDAKYKIHGIRRNVPLKGYSTFNVGGPADYFYEARDLNELPRVLDAANESGIPVFLFGGGSNVLFSDEGFRGLVVRMMADGVRAEGKLIAEAGAKWPAILRAMKEAGLQGCREFEGLPGTIGGAIVGNAGCFGLEMKDIFESAKIYDREKGEIREVGPDYFDFKYRWSHLKETNDVVLEVTLKFSSANADSDKKSLESSNENSAEIIPPEFTTQAARQSTQPPGRSSGSFFKNPTPNPEKKFSDKSAGWLIDQCELKGKTSENGRAQISPKHANFFMNLGGATATDILELRDLAQKAVLEKFGIELHEEVVIVD